MNAYTDFEYDGRKYRAKGTFDYVVAVKDLEDDEVVIDGHQLWLTELNTGLLFAAAAALRECYER